MVADRIGLAGLALFHSRPLVSYRAHTPPPLKSMKPLLAGVSALVCCLGNPAGIDDTYEIDAIELAWHQCDQGDLSACERASELINFDY